MRLVATDVARSVAHRSLRWNSISVGHRNHATCDISSNRLHLCNEQAIRPNNCGPICHACQFPVSVFWQFSVFISRGRQTDYTPNPRSRTSPEFCVRRLLPWLGPPLVALRYTVCSGFVDDVFFHIMSYMACHMYSKAKTSASIPTKSCWTVKTTNYVIVGWTSEQSLPSTITLLRRRRGVRRAWACAEEFGLLVLRMTATTSRTNRISPRSNASAWLRSYSTFIRLSYVLCVLLTPFFPSTSTPPLLSLLLFPFHFTLYPYLFSCLCSPFLLLPFPSLPCPFPFHSPYRSIPSFFAPIPYLLLPPLFLSSRVLPFLFPFLALFFLAFSSPFGWSG